MMKKSNLKDNKDKDTQQKKQVSWADLKAQKDPTQKAQKDPTQKEAHSTSSIFKPRSSKKELDDIFRGSNVDDSVVESTKLGKEIGFDERDYQNESNKIESVKQTQAAKEAAALLQKQKEDEKALKTKQKEEKEKVKEEENIIKEATEKESNINFVPDRSHQTHEKRTYGRKK